MQCYDRWDLPNWLSRRRDGKHCNLLMHYFSVLLNFSTNANSWWSCSGNWSSTVFCSFLWKLSEGSAIKDTGLASLTSSSRSRCYPICNHLSATPTPQAWGHQSLGESILLLFLSFVCPFTSAVQCRMFPPFGCNMPTSREHVWCGSNCKYLSSFSSTISIPDFRDDLCSSDRRQLAE